MVVVDARLLQQVGERLAVEDFGWVRRDRPAGEDVEVLEVGRLHGLCQRRAVGDGGRHAPLVLEAEALGLGRLAQVGVEDQGALAGLGHRDREARRGRRLAVLRRRGGDLHDVAVGVGEAEVDGGAERARGLGVVALLLPELQRREVLGLRLSLVRHRGEDWKLEALADLLGRAHARVEHPLDPCEAEAEQQAEQQARQQLDRLAGRDLGLVGQGVVEHVRELLARIGVDVDSLQLRVGRVQGPLGALGARGQLTELDGVAVDRVERLLRFVGEAAQLRHLDLCERDALAQRGRQGGSVFLQLDPVDPAQLLDPRAVGREGPVERCDAPVRRLELDEQVRALQLERFDLREHGRLGLGRRERRRRRDQRHVAVTLTEPHLRQDLGLFPEAFGGLDVCLRVLDGAHGALQVLLQLREPGPHRVDVGELGADARVLLAVGVLGLQRCFVFLLVAASVLVDDAVELRRGVLLHLALELLVAVDHLVDERAGFFAVQAVERDRDDVVVCADPRFEAVLEPRHRDATLRGDLRARKLLLERCDRAAQDLARDHDLGLRRRVVAAGEAEAEHLGAQLRAAAVVDVDARPRPPDRARLLAVDPARGGDEQRDREDRPAAPPQHADGLAERELVRGVAVLRRRRRSGHWGAGVGAGGDGSARSFFRRHVSTCLAHAQGGAAVLRRMC